MNKVHNVKSKIKTNSYEREISISNTYFFTNYVSSLFLIMNFLFSDCELVISEISLCFCHHI